MTADLKLVEAVARAICGMTEGSEGNWRAYKDGAGTIIAAINASGEWWVAPVEATERMAQASTMIAPTWDNAISRQKFAAMRTAYLAKPAEETR